jgi:hypothetical protein
MVCWMPVKPSLGGAGLAICANLWCAALSAVVPSVPAKRVRSTSNVLGDRLPGSAKAATNSAATEVRLTK